MSICICMLKLNWDGYVHTHRYCVEFKPTPSLSTWFTDAPILKRKLLNFVKMKLPITRDKGVYNRDFLSKI